MTMTALIVPATALAISPWPNKAGRKADIASGPGWLVAFAWLDQEARFSDYTGTDRTITLIDGGGFSLCFDDGNVIHANRLSPISFDGGLGLTCRLPHGRCRVLNVMTERSRLSHRVRIGTQGWGQGQQAVMVALEDNASLACDGQTHSLARWDSAVFETYGDIRTTGLFACLDIM